MTETPTYTPEEIRARRESRRTWFGYLADDNVEHVAQRIRNLLNGRRYTFVAFNTEHVAHAMPEVRTGQRLTPEKRTDGQAIGVHRIGDPLGYVPHDGGSTTSTSAGLSAADTYGAWGLHTSHATEEEAYRDADDPAKRHRATYLRIEGGVDPEDVGRSNRIEVRHFNYMNPPQMLVWVIAIELPEEDM